MRTALTVLAIALGVAVVLAIDLAGTAATGSFHSSMETLTGDHNLEVIAGGGVPENVIGTLSTLPYPIRLSPRIEDYAVVVDSKRTLPLFGLDLIAEASRGADKSASFDIGESQDALKYLGEYDSIWVGQSLRHKAGDQLSLLIHDQVRTYVVRGVYPDAGGSTAAIVMDLAAAQRALNRFGHVDRILARIPQTLALEEWQRRLQEALPAGVEVRPAGTGTVENRRMLGAFRWNLRLLSYIALLVGAFLIYNTISVSVVRRRAEIGIIRALGASRGAVLLAFAGEAASLGFVGSLIGLPLGRLMASGAVKVMGATVEALYVSSRPGEIRLTTGSMLLAIAIGVGVSIVSAYSPAREASLVPPVEAMARGRREYILRVHKVRDLWWALCLGLLAAVASRAPSVSGKPFFGYIAAFLLVVASILAVPALVDALTLASSEALGKIVGVEALLASRSLSGSLRRTSVLVGALSTAIAMMTAIGIMVGSFRQTVLSWMGTELPADLYLRPAGEVVSDRHPTIAVDVAERISHLPGIAAIDRIREYEISFDGVPTTLASADLSVVRTYHKVDFLSGRSTDRVLGDSTDAFAVLVSEPFASKHHVRAGDSISIPLGMARPSFHIADVYYDYSSERGGILMDRKTMLQYLPDPAPSNLVIYVDPRTPPENVRAEIEKAAAGHRVAVFSSRDLRREALRIFDRTFAITYALEAVAVSVAVMGIAGALLALVIDRRRELGLLRFLGAASEQIRKLILVEAGLLGLLATLAGAALGFTLSLILIFVINKQSFGWTIRFHWPVTVILGGLTVVYVATLLAGLYPAKVAVGLNPIEVVHEE